MMQDFKGGLDHPNEDDVHGNCNHGMKGEFPADMFEFHLNVRNFMTYPAGGRRVAHDSTSQMKKIKFSRAI
jgi:hypothetical protein